MRLNTVVKPLALAASLLLGAGCSSATKPSLERPQALTGYLDDGRNLDIHNPMPAGAGLPDFKGAQGPVSRFFTNLLNPDK